MGYLVLPCSNRSDSITSCYRLVVYRDATFDHLTILSFSLMRVLLVLLLIGFSNEVVAQNLDSDEEQLRSLHAQLIQAHLEGRVDLWMTIEADSFVSINRGNVTFPKSDERREGRASYLQDASFSVYRDLREPLVRISDDGSLGWLIAEVEVEGTIPDADGVRSSFRDVWAWIELYEKTDAGWRMIGNASNRR